jgi:hypothetical protein
MTPPSQFISLLSEEQMKRHEWLLRAGEQLLGDCAARTAAGQQSPSQVSLSRPCRVTIDYRKKEK